MNRFTMTLSLACAAAGFARGHDLIGQVHGPWAPSDPTTVVRGCCTGSGAPTLAATRLNGASIRIDGVADEAVWATAPVATGFVQFEPGEGEPATERTEARVLYGEAVLFVAIRAFDSSPSEIVGQLTRRDQGSHSDLLGVVIDSYFDRRTAFHFAVNPVGVKHDIYRFDDTGEDSGWDAVWDVATSIDEGGWTAEFAIPYSQLRFRDGPDQTWGINFLRNVARRQETDVWAPVARSEGAIVSRFGNLTGLRDLESSSRMEIMPYSLARLQRAPGSAADPYYRRNARSGAAGLDIKHGVTSNLTLDVTINPDFGQVEADPAQVNLTALETFLPERRPFFLEGASIFNFGIALGDGDGASESLFYSRRIGRAPQRSPDAAGGFADADPQTTILGAWKLSGKTASGWSIGAMHAMTSEENASVTPGAGGEYEEPIEPFANYGVLRVQKDFREGRSAVGFIGTGTHRSAGVADALGLRSDAFAGGVDFRHRFAGGSWQLNGYIIGSYVGGSAGSIATAQRSSVRYFQRPDADHVEFDPTRTSLTGNSANFGVSKFAGSPWRVGTGVQSRSPGFEVNDIGFQNQADQFTHWVWLGYQQSTPQGAFRRWNLNFNGWHVYDHGWDRVATGLNLNANYQLQNFWNGWLGVNQDLDNQSDGALRGGPAMMREAQTNFWGGIGTDSRKAVQVNLGGFGNVRPKSDSWTLSLNPNVRVRPSGRASFNVGTSINRNVNDRQWVGRFDTDTPAYLHGRLDQTTVGITTRVDYAFTPTLSLQLYAQPFVSAGRYDDFKTVAAPMADSYADRFSAVTTRSESGQYLADLDGDGTEESFSDPDFNFRQFRSNAVLRWEYRPGSALFVVWSQGRNDFTGNGAFDFDGDVRDLFSVHPDNVFMVKFTYWLSR